MPAPRIQVIYDTRIGVPEEISAYLHCTKCLAERPADVSPREYARTQIGVHAKGFQVVCTRHDVNIAVLELKIK